MTNLKEIFSVYCSAKQCIYSAVSAQRYVDRYAIAINPLAAVRHMMVGWQYARYNLLIGVTEHQGTNYHCTNSFGTNDRFPGFCQ